MKRPLLLALVVALVALAVVGAIGVVAVTRVEKRAQIALVRATAPGQQASPPRLSDAGAPAAAAPRVRRIDFSGTPAPDNLFLAHDPHAAPDESFFQDKSAHHLNLENLGPRPFSVDTNDTFINYKNGKLVWAKVYLAPDTVSFREAVAIVDARLRPLALGDRFDAREYDRHLGEVIDHEIWAPELELGHARLTPQLNCNWEWHQPARAQVERVACRPLFSITVPAAAPGPAATSP